MGSYLNSLIGYATTTMPFLVSGTVAGTSGASASVSRRRCRVQQRPHPGSREASRLPRSP
jgi:hypothetical protein